MFFLLLILGILSPFQIMYSGNFMFHLWLKSYWCHIVSCSLECMGQTWFHQLHSWSQNICPQYYWRTWEHQHRTLCSNFDCYSINQIGSSSIITEEIPETAFKTKLLALQQPKYSLHRTYKGRRQVGIPVWCSKVLQRLIFQKKHEHNLLITFLYSRP